LLSSFRLYEGLYNSHDLGLTFLTIRSCTIIDKLKTEREQVRREEGVEKGREKRREQKRRGEGKGGEKRTEEKRGGEGRGGVERRREKK
jgi:hypothetical protein